MNVTKSKVEEVIQIMRTLTTAQIRRQLELDEGIRYPRFKAVVEFFQMAKEQMK